MSSRGDSPGTDDAAEMAHGPRLPAHLYIHVPFCRSKCSYCDFASMPAPPPALVAGTFAGMEAQLSQWAGCGLSGVLETVYVGGGTPSAWPAPVAALLRTVRELFVVHAAAEITVEANPDSLDATSAAVLAEAGATRVSVGVQSFDDRVLGFLGRRHDAAAARRACAAARETGAALCVDLMCGVPGQGDASWRDSLEQAVEAGATHVSVYPLAVEEDTPLAVAVAAGLAPEPDPDAAAGMMVAAEEILQGHGIVRYEVSNHAVQGLESRHNTAYWTGRPYLGVGPGAHGMLDAETARALGVEGAEDEDVARVRYRNAADVDDWLLGRGDRAELLGRGEAAREDVMLGLRLARGVPFRQAVEANVTEVLEDLAAAGLVELAGSNWQTTRRGWLLGNEVFSRVWAGE